MTEQEYCDAQTSLFARLADGHGEAAKVPFRTVYPGVARCLTTFGSCLVDSVLVVECDEVCSAASRVVHASLPFGA